MGKKSRLKLVENIQQPLTFLNSILLPETYIKFLGLHLDSSLDFTKHITTVISKTTGRIRFLYRTAKNLTKETRKLLYNALVSPDLMSCDSVWTKCTV